MNASPHWQPQTAEEKLARIKSLAEVMEPDEIANTLKMTPAEVRDALKRIPRVKWWGQNKKTGQCIYGFGARAVYLRACLLGWTEWWWGEGEVVGQGVKP